MYSVLKTTLTHEELLENEKTGKHNTCDNVYLRKRYADVWQMCDRLFSKWSDQELAVEEREILNPDGQSKFYFKRDDLLGSINFDVYPVPLNLDVYDRSEYVFPDRTIKNVMKHPYIARTKFILKSHQITDYFVNQPADEVFDYFMQMYVDFSPVLEHYRNEYFNDKESHIAMNVIRYSVPFATDDVWLQRKANATLWGVEHYDQNYAGLHVGDSSDEFRVYNRYKGIWEQVDFNNIRTLFMWGDPEVTGLEWHGTYHGMQAPSKSATSTNRYSIILDLVPGKSGL